MINVPEILRNIMNEYNLNQTQLSRAVNCDSSLISRYLSGARKPDYETLENMINPFGYSLSVERIKKPEKAKCKSFYMEKTYEELKLLTKEELIDYTFVTQDESILADICHVAKDIFTYLPLEKQREVLTDRMRYVEALEVYFRISRLYKGLEWEMASFLEGVKYHIENISNISEEILEKAEYIVFDGYYLVPMYDEEYYRIYNFRLLDKDRNLLGVSSDDIENCEAEEGDLKYSMSDALGDYYIGKSKYGEKDIEIKLNY